VDSKVGAWRGMVHAATLRGSVVAAQVALVSVVLAVVEGGGGRVIEQVLVEGGGRGRSAQSDDRRRLVGVVGVVGVVVEVVEHERAAALWVGRCRGVCHV